MFPQVQGVWRHPGPVGTSVKVVERPGPPITRGLSRNNPFPRLSCGRNKCPLADSNRGCREDCSSEGILYAAFCKKCEEDPSVTNNIYIGETSRTLWIRANQHKEDYQRVSRSNGTCETTSFMWDHWLAKHSQDGRLNPDDEYRFQIISNHRDPFDRQINEAVKIERALESKIFTGKNNKDSIVESLNRKFEHFCPRPRPEKYGGTGV